jgi:AcrR family transcriptional regulator
MGCGRVAQANPPEGGPREIRRRGRIELSREQLLDTAEELFSERGYHATGLKEVAKRCEFSVGSIYQFFESKDALYEEVLMRREPEWSAEMARIAASNAPADTHLLALARMQVVFFLRYPAWVRLTIRVLTTGVGPGTDLPARFLRAFDAAMDLQGGLFARGQRAGVLCDGNPRALARLYSSLVSAFHGLDTQISYDPEEYAAEDFLALIRDTFTVRH